MGDENHELLLREGLELYRDVEKEDAAWELIHRLRRLGSPETFEACKALCGSGDEVERGFGADVISQLGGTGTDHPFRPQAIPILTSLLGDTDEEVLNSAIVGLGHMNAHVELLEHRHLARHPSPRVRFAVAFAFGCIETDTGIRTLIRLSRDQDDEVRDWATFGLGSLCERNTKAIRDALFSRIDDPHDDTRNEAIVGLARRKVGEVLPALIKELEEGKYLFSLSVEAATELAAPCLPVD